MDEKKPYSDRVELSGGGEPMPEHREIDPLTGQQRGYLVLTGAERAKGFVRPVRHSYRHLKCGNVTSMAKDIAETYARDPKFYSGTFCSACRAHFPLIFDEEPQFVWLPDGSAVGS